MNPPDDILYRKALLRLAADATGAGQLPAPHASASRHNPACGDRVTVQVALQDGRITTLAHQTQACVLTQASAAVLGTHAPGRDRAAVAALAESVAAMLAGGPAPLPVYEAFAGAGDHAGRHRCVMLPLEALLAALDAEEGG